MSRPSAIVAMALVCVSGCATPDVGDPTRHGQPVIDTTIAAILSNPEAWEDKYVRLSGYVSGDGSMAYADECLVRALSARKQDPCLDQQPTFGLAGYVRGGAGSELIDLSGYGIIDLEPERHRRPGEDRNHMSISAALVVGHVQLECLRFYQNRAQQMEQLPGADQGGAETDVVLLVEPLPATGKFAYCDAVENSVHLDDVLIERTGNDQ